MKSIKFSDDELEFLKEQYSDELANAQQYVDQIKEILKKLDVPIKGMIEARTEKQTKKEKKKERKAKAKAAETKEPKKRGRKPKVTFDSIVSAIAAEPLKKQEPKNHEPKLSKKRGRKPKIQVPEGSIAVSNTIEPATIEEKMVMPKAKKEVKATAKVKVEKKPVVNAVSKPISEPKTKKQIITRANATIQKNSDAMTGSKPKLQQKTVSQVNPVSTTVPKSEPKLPLKKEITKVLKKKPLQEKKPVKATTPARTGKPLSKKEPVAEPTTSIPPVVEPVIFPTDKTPE